ncbi:MAG TPA: signal peptidase I [Polyangiaceae bacterium]|nr:signal peptidase I [Polyangiaceae bacterium]
MKTIFRLILWITVALAALLGILRATCIRLWTMPGDDALLSLSVMPTLEAGDELVLWRVGIPGFGELVECPDPEAPGRFVVGRILGEPGDTVVVDRAYITVNDKGISSRRACPKFSVIDPQTSESLELTCEVEEAGGIEYARARASKPPVSMAAPFRVKVPDGNVFLASDNRYYHDDSRDFGPMPKTSCQERVLFRLWSARGWFDAPRRLTFIH